MSEDERDVMLRQLLAEQKLVIERLAALTSELRTRKVKAARRQKTVRERSAAELIAKYQPTDVEVARMRRKLGR